MTLDVQKCLYNSEFLIESEARIVGIAHMFHIVNWPTMYQKLTAENKEIQQISQPPPRRVKNFQFYEKSEILLLLGCFQSPFTIQQMLLP